MKFKFKPGSKGPQDQKLLICTASWEQLTYKDLFTMVRFFYLNEERIYSPPRCKGSKMLLDALEYLRTHTVDETLLEFQLRKAMYLEDFI